MAIPAKNRLPLRKERDRLNREGKVFHTKLFTVVKVSSPEGIVSPRFGILLSKKTAKLAVDRNLIKRKVSSIIIESLSRFPVSDYLIIPKSQALEAPVADLKSDLLSII